MAGLAVQEGADMNAALSVAVRGRAGGIFPIGAAFESRGGITALFGPSGSGKTSILRMIAGVLKPDEGRITIGDRVLFDAAAGVNLPPGHRRIGYVFQDGRLFPHLSVRRNLTYARWAGRRSGARSLEEVAGLLGLGGLLMRAPHTLSGGERQRVAIGRALLADPDLLLMDEPLASLDHARRQDVLPYMEALRETTGIPIVYVTHEVNEIARLADTLVLVAAGRVTEFGPAAEVFPKLEIRGHAPGVLLEGVVAGVDTGSALVKVGAETIEIHDSGLKIGQKVRLTIRARDVALARARPEEISIRNIFRVRIEQIRGEAGSEVEVLLSLGEQRLKARITRKSAHALQLVEGEPVFALLKAATIEREALRSG
jgi:molybdate transport system ATP-binding protein